MNQNITNETILTALNEFPLLKDMLIEVAEATQAPLELVLASALSTISLLCQPLIDVERPGKMIGPVSLMVISIAQSGERKSTVESMFMGAVRVFVINAIKAHEKELLVWRIKSEAWEARKRKIIKEMSDHPETDPAYKHFENELILHHELKPERPRAFNPIYEDATTAALLKGMRLDCPWAALMSSEGISALKGVFNDFGKINALWTGSTIDVARATVEGCSLNDVRLTIGIMIQPQILKEYLEGKGDRARSVGLLSRALVFNPESTQGKRFINKRPINKEVIARYQSRANQLLEKSIQRLRNITEEKEIIKFSSSAAEYWTESYNNIEYELQKGGKYERSKDHASKLSENIARVAALLHYFELGNGIISLAELKSAEKIVLECSKTFRNEFTFMPNIISDAETLHAWLQSNCKHSPLFNWVEKNTVLYKGPGKFRTISKLNPLLDCLEAQGKITVDYTKKPVRIILKLNS
ncbi:YfjI family protein [Pseudomonas putida]|uniref:YfjI family protein n=1 Tax=Pseudomonas putida TaxID=303 RepID=UPI0034656761